MARAALDVLGTRIRGGLVVSSEPAQELRPLVPIVGGHPTPTSGSEEAGRIALEIAAALDTDEELLVLLSGGASSLMAAPIDGVTLADKTRTTEMLLRAGADIHSLNAVRKHLSRIKGGWLAAAAPARCRTLALSDVVDDDLSVIGSGPTAGDPTTFRDALDALDKHGGAKAYPSAVVDRLARGAAGAVEETPKPGDARLARSETAIVGSRRDAMRGAEEQARARGYQVVTLDAPVVGEARDAAKVHVSRVAAAAQNTGRRPVCVVSSGETTVRVRGNGRGGRNQELALAAAPLMPSLELAVGASLGTDGIDGNTRAAGAIVDSTTMDRARAAGLNPAEFLNDNNSHAFFAALGDLIETGPTGTNVCDLQVFLVGN
jgi:glycerate 2-kinase